MICKIADFVFNFENPSPNLENFLKEYISDGTPQFSINVTPQEIEENRNITSIETNMLQGEINVFHHKLLNNIVFFGALFFHASLIEVNGLGVAFTAISGTGKTTHTLLWQKLLGDKMQIINGDKPIIRFDGEIPYGYGTPWNGKERLGKNAKTPIKHICFIERSEENYCEKITSQEALKDVFSQLFIPKDTAAALKTLELLDKLLKSVDIWIIKCNTDISAAETAYCKIFEGETL